MTPPLMYAQRSFGRRHVSQGSPRKHVALLLKLSARLCAECIHSQGGGAAILLCDTTNCTPGWSATEGLVAVGLAAYGVLLCDLWAVNGYTIDMH